MQQIIIFLLLFSSTARSYELIIWNVGQGQWVSEVAQDSCIHFDMGGEFSPLPKVLVACQKKKNFISISHLDWDHISFIKSFVRTAPNACLIQDPVDRTHQKFRQQIIRHIQPCKPESIPPSFRSLYLGNQNQKANDASSVVYSNRYKTIIPGDSPKSLERHWRWKVGPAKILILGHHGSRTSTAKVTLKKLRYLNMAIASARQKKYGHPHIEIQHLLEEQKIPLLRTEDWGNIHLLK